MAAATVATTAAERPRKHLTFTQRIALRAVLVAMPQNEGTVVTSTLADAEGIGRGVAVTAITLAEVAGLIWAQSMGMKGTRIRILDRAALEEVVGQ